MKDFQNIEAERNCQCGCAKGGCGCNPCTCKNCSC
jgi:hypothetical protein